MHPLTWYFPAAGVLPHLRRLYGSISRTSRGNSCSRRNGDPHTRMWQLTSPITSINLSKPSYRGRSKFREWPSTIHRTRRLQSPSFSISNRTALLELVRSKYCNHQPKRRGAMQSRCVRSRYRQRKHLWLLRWPCLYRNSAFRQSTAHLSLTEAVTN